MSDDHDTRAGVSGSGDAAPDYPTPIVGYRVMRVQHGGRLLVSPMRTAYYWRPGAVADAQCASAPHRAPDPDCRCGLYARLSLDDVAAGGILFTPWSTQVIARVEAWGDSYLGASGIRAQRMRIAAILDAPFSSDDRGRAAAWYDVPLEDYDGPASPDDARIVVASRRMGKLNRLVQAAANAIGTDGSRSHLHIAFVSAAPISVHSGPPVYHSTGRAVDVVAESALTRIAKVFAAAGYRAGSIVRDGLSIHHATRVAQAFAPERVASDCAAGDCPLPSRDSAMTCARHAHVTDLDHPRGGGDHHGHRNGTARDHRWAGRRGAASARRTRGG